MDIEQFCVEKGRGAPLILLHGNGESGEYFKNQIGVFSSRYHVYALDTRGHGKTPRGKAGIPPGGPLYRQQKTGGI